MLLSYGVLGSVLLLLLVLIWGRIAAYQVFLSLITAYYLLGWISLEGALSNFTNPALITLVLLLLVSSVLEKTTLFKRIGNWLLTKNTRQAILRMASTAGIGSALLNNTAIVATFMSFLGRASQIAPSKLLLPLSYLSIFGGTLTLIGTSTHLVINGFLLQAGLPTLGLLDFFYVGIFILVLGSGLVIFLAPQLLPNLSHREDDYTEYFIEMRLSENSSLVGQSIELAGLRRLQSFFLAQVVTQGNVHSPVSPKYVLKPGDHLIFVGDIRQASGLLAFDGLHFSEGHNPRKNELIEVVVSQNSPMLGSSIKQANFRNKFDAVVIAVCRGNQKLSGRIGDLVIEAGDALVLLAGADFEKRENLKRNFYIYSQLESVNGFSNRSSLVVLGSFLTLLTLSTLGFLSLEKGLILLLVLFLFLGYTRINELRRRVPVELALIIGSALAISQVLSDSGAAQLIADAVMFVFGDWGVWGALIGVYLLTVLITELVTNNAAAAICFPIALATSQALDVSFWPFVMVVAYGASASFMTPYGYQTNLMVYSAGNYRFQDYLRLGGPVSLLYGVIVLGLVPVFFPF